MKNQVLVIRCRRAAPTRTEPCVPPAPQHGASPAAPAGEAPLCGAQAKSTYRIPAGSSAPGDSPQRPALLTPGLCVSSAGNPRDSAETHCFHRRLGLPGAPNFRSTDVPTGRGGSRSKGAAGLKEFKLALFWHSAGTGMEMNHILQAVSPNFPHRHS